MVNLPATPLGSIDKLEVLTNKYRKADTQEQEHANKPKHTLHFPLLKLFVSSFKPRSAPQGTMQTGSLHLAMQTENLHDDTRTALSGHSGRLVYAKPQDLPSFPSLGLKANGSAASAAASLGWANQKSPELWKPDKSASASAAAVLAKDHKLPTTWTPTPSSHGAQAAILAHKTAKSAESWKPSATDQGHSAAAQAFKADRTVPDSRTPAINRQRSLMAAKGAMTTRPRAQSNPTPKESYPDEINAAANALKAATKAHNPKRASSMKQSRAMPYTNMNRQMLTSNLMGKTVQEQSREEELHASAVAMAKKMFVQQQIMIDAAKKSHINESPAPRSPRRGASSSSDDAIQPMKLNTLQDAAYKLAQERLAKLHEDNLKNRDYQDYYGQSRPQRKFSVKAKLRKRASSDGAATEDKTRAQNIRKSMTIFSSKLSEVDDKKRQHDRDALLAAAQRNVRARMKVMDDKVAEKTGMIPPSSLSQWETKANTAAQARSEKRLSKHGKIDIGAGKFMDQGEIDAIAAAKVQPVLEEINEKAEKEHARQTELRLVVERKKEDVEREKSREKEVQCIYKNLKDQEKQELKEKRAEEKQEAKTKKEEEKAVKAESKRLAKAEKRKSAPATSQQSKQAEEPADIDPDITVALNDVGQPVKISKPATPQTPTPGGNQGTFKTQIPEEHKLDQRPRSSSSSPKSPTDKVKTWFRSRFSRGSKSDDEKSKVNNRKSFIGGAALTGMDRGNESTTSLDDRSNSMRAIALAGRRRTDLSEDQARTPVDADDVSPMSRSNDDEYFRDEARDRVGVGLPAPRPLQDPAARKSQSPVRDSRFHEII